MTWICSPPMRSCTRSACARSFPHQRSGAIAAGRRHEEERSDRDGRAEEDAHLHRVTQVRDNDTVADEVDRLYKLPLEEFTAARNELAKRLGDTSVKQLKKPTVPAWTVNQLARTREVDVRRLLRAGEQLEQAQKQAVEGGDQQAFERARGGRARRAAPPALAGRGPAASRRSPRERLDARAGREHAPRRLRDGGGESGVARGTPERGARAAGLRRPGGREARSAEGAEERPGQEPRAKGTRRRRRGERRSRSSRRARTRSGARARRAAPCRQARGREGRAPASEGRGAREGEPLCGARERPGRRSGPGLFC